jgi:hypothetical protein
MPGHQSVKAKPELNPWSTLGAREERNKENSAVPTKWTTYKVGLPFKRAFSPPIFIKIPFQQAFNFENMLSLRFRRDLELELEG